MSRFVEDEEREAAEPRRDTELTLGVGSLIGLFACLVLLCALCFWLGYAMGRRGTEPSLTASSQAAQGAATAMPSAGTAAKPSASDASGQSATASPSEAADSEAENSTASSAAGATPAQGPAAAAQPKQPPNQAVPQQPLGAMAQAPVQTAAQTPAQTPAQVHPALTAATTAQTAALPAASAVQPALASDTQLMVQIAALRSSDDAAVLVSALRKRGYEVNVRREQSDGFYHVRIGPFRSRADAETMRNKLLNDGYNAVVQP